MSIKIHGKNYVLVNERLELFLTENPLATVDTHIHSILPIVDSSTGDACNEYVVVAKIIANPLENPEVYYTGHAAERDNNGFINKTSALENAETSAVGRALAFAGYGSEDSIASAEEVVNATNKQKTINPTVTQLDKLDRSMNDCYKQLLITDSDKLRYRNRRTAGMTKNQVEASQKYFDDLLDNKNTKKKESK